ncbi:MAG: hypothetical protein LBU04_02225 [Christensenellaceae bacterium]|jgi:hypothetical protein|nr:hypothetical protein [Christensenellaceae bacterium]
MVKCFYCGDINSDGVNFCNKCGKPISKPRPSSAEQAMEIAKKEFEKNAKISLDKSKITFICELCGTVNGIDNLRCVRCGKPRPRSEFVAALRRLKESGKLADCATVSASEAVQPQLPVEETDQIVYRFEPDTVGAENASISPRSIVQQLIIVPYVNPAQSLWQYNPNIVYRLEK